MKKLKLENQIIKETKLRNKTEKRLKLLIKKLQSLYNASTSVISTESEISTNFSPSKETENQESKSILKNQCQKILNITTSKPHDEKKPNRNAPCRLNSSPNSESPNNSYIDPQHTSEIPHTKDQRY